MKRHLRKTVILMEYLQLNASRILVLQLYSNAAVLVICNTQRDETLELKVLQTTISAHSQHQFLFLAQMNTEKTKTIPF